METSEEWKVEITFISDKEFFSLELLKARDDKESVERRNSMMDVIVNGGHLEDTSHVIAPQRISHNYVQLARSSHKILLQAAAKLDPNVEVTIQTKVTQITTRLNSN